MLGVVQELRLARLQQRVSVLNFEARLIGDVRARGCMITASLCAGDSCITKKPHNLQGKPLQKSLT